MLYCMFLWMTFDWRSLIFPAVLAVFGGIVLERFKTRTAEKKTEREVRAQVIAEVKEGVFKLYGLRPVVAEEDWATADIIAAGVNSDRFLYYRDSQKAVIYKIDRHVNLERFHRYVSESRQAIVQRSADSDRQIRIAIVEGKAFLKDNNSDFEVDPKTFEELYTAVRDPRNASIINDITDPQL
jgi:hypothetical protein